HQPRQERPRAALHADHQQQHQRGEPGRLRLRHRGRPAGHLTRADRHLPLPGEQGGAIVSELWPSAPLQRPGMAAVRVNKRRLTAGRVSLHAFLIVMALAWLFPLAWPVYTALRPIGDTVTNGY